MPRSTSLEASASECADSARRAVDPEISPLISFAMAMTTFAASAIRIVRVLSLLSILWSAARERRYGGRSMSTHSVQLRRFHQHCWKIGAIEYHLSAQVSRIEPWGAQHAFHEP